MAQPNFVEKLTEEDVEILVTINVILIEFTCLNRYRARTRFNLLSPQPRSIPSIL